MLKSFGACVYTVYSGLKCPYKELSQPPAAALFKSSVVVFTAVTGNGTVRVILLFIAVVAGGGCFTWGAWDLFSLLLALP